MSSQKVQLTLTADQAFETARAVKAGLRILDDVKTVDLAVERLKIILGEVLDKLNAQNEPLLFSITDKELSELCKAHPVLSDHFDHAVFLDGNAIGGASRAATAYKKCELGLFEFFDFLVIQDEGKFLIKNIVQVG